MRYERVAFPGGPIQEMLDRLQGSGGAEPLPVIEQVIKLISDWVTYRVSRKLTLYDDLRPRLGTDTIAPNVLTRVLRHLQVKPPVHAGVFRGMILQHIDREITDQVKAAKALRRNAKLEIRDEQAPKGISSDQTSPFALLDKKERIQQLRAALDQLPQPQRRTMEMAWIERLPVRVIAKREGVDESTVYYRIRSSISTLKLLLLHVARTP